MAPAEFKSTAVSTLGSPSRSALAADPAAVPATKMVEPATPSEPPASVLLEGQVAVEAALLEELLRALRDGAPQICCMDPDFQRWPLSSPVVLEALKHWVAPHRRLRLLAHDYQALARRHPRFVQWRQLYGHVVEARQLSDEGPVDHRRPVALLLGRAPRMWRLIEARQGRAVVECDSSAHGAALEWFDAVSQRSEESFASSTLGL
jgi:hypothetical protein